MTAYLAVIVTLGTALLVATAYMEWIGVLNVFTRRTNPSYETCGHQKLNLGSHHDQCWRCRHARTARSPHTLHQ